MCTALGDMLGVMMNNTANESPETELLATVALLSDLPEKGLARGQVGTIVERLDERMALVEFSDVEGRACALVACARDALLTLRPAPLAA